MIVEINDQQVEIPDGLSGAELESVIDEIAGEITPQNQVPAEDVTGQTVATASGPQETVIEQGAQRTVAPSEDTVGYQTLPSESMFGGGGSERVVLDRTASEEVEDARTAEGRSTSLQQGLSLGFQDEIQGAVASTFGDGTYEEVRDRERDANAEFKRTNPGEALTGELAGSLINPLGRAKVLPTGSTRLERVLNSAKAGAVEGTVAGAGYSDADNISELATDTAIGTAIGGVIAPTADQILEAGNNLISRAFIKDLKATESTSQTLQRQNAQELEDSLRRANIATDGQATYADLGIFDERLQRAVRESPVQSDKQRSLNERTKVAQANVLDATTPKARAGDTLGGRQVVAEDLNADSSINAGRFANNSRQIANDQATPFYNRSAGANFTNQDRADLTTLYQRSPDFQSAYRAGLDNARSFQASQGNRRLPTESQILQETVKVLGNRVTGLKKGNTAGSDQSVAALTGLRTQLSDLLKNRSPAYADAQAITATGQQARGNIEAGQQGLTGNVDQVDDALRGIDIGSAQAEQVELGARSRARELQQGRFDSESFDTSTGKALKPNEIKNLNKLTNDSSDVAGLIDSEAQVRRTANLARQTGEGTPVQLREILKDLAVTTSAGLGLLAVFDNPTLVGASIVAGRLGYSRVSKMSKRKLAEETKSVLLKEGVTQDDLTKLLSGDFYSIDPQRLSEIGNTVSRLLIPQATEEAVTDNQ
ncbi:hypothetical protein [Psychromonas sp. Urea-02u-13]|uniref:hypothetical protein n=1 Tax=Psychromonas sp. Urea-02u-13 TaxID=2058326 RepID=UPI000C327542|nr:hypothetical protein [Psychromonas sp. Urea-02u-13]PKG37722.1 hypothetical protein CXF74_17460 [Psychromonas sp. Urea-02u-13]